jgi:hypothetical protein
MPEELVSAYTRPSQLAHSVVKLNTLKPRWLPHINILL